jgi:hypothetical protein
MLIRKQAKEKHVDIYPSYHKVLEAKNRCYPPINCKYNNNRIVGGNSAASPSGSYGFQNSRSTKTGDFEPASGINYQFGAVGKMGLRW